MEVAIDGVKYRPVDEAEATKLAERLREFKMLAGVEYR